MSRLTIELRPGVFVGNINRRVREKLWDKICYDWNANALMIYTTNNEQGYAALSWGDTTRDIIEFEGMVLTQFEHNRKDQMRYVEDHDTPVYGNTAVTDSGSSDAFEETTGPFEESGQGTLFIE